MLFGVRMIPYGMRYLSEAVQSLSKVIKLKNKIIFFYSRQIGAILQFEQYNAEFCAPKANTLAIQLQNCTFAWDVEPEKENGNGKEKKQTAAVEQSKKINIIN